METQAAKADTPMNNIGEQTETVPGRVWGWYAELQLQLAEHQGHRIHNRQAFLDATACDGIRRLHTLANRWWSMFDLTPKRLAECLIDGHAPRYAQRR